MILATKEDCGPVCRTVYKRYYKSFGGEKCNSCMFGILEAKTEEGQLLSTCCSTTGKGRNYMSD